jgi:hypothetical protein
MFVKEVTMKLEKHLVLNRYFFNLFGFEDFNGLREKLIAISNIY